jgi:hydrogenase large subunit
MTGLVIDPVTRVGGQLRIEAELTGGVVTDAWSAGTLFRGIERVLEGRDPRDAWLLAQRICGLCTGAHALASVRAVERALGIAVPRNARLIRNLLAGAQLVQSHVAGFYQLHALDWVDVGVAATADPAAAWNIARSVSSRSLVGDSNFRLARDHWAAYLSSEPSGALAASAGPAGAYALSPGANLMIAAHYLEAFQWRRAMTRLQAYLGGKSPHPQTYLVGGMALAPEWGGPAPLRREHPQQVVRGAPPALSDRGLADLADLVAQARSFVDEVYLPDVNTLAGAYRDWTGIGGGIGNYLSYGEFPEDDSSNPALLLPRGRVMARDLGAAQGVDQEGVAETIVRAHYAGDGDPGGLVRPPDEAVRPLYQGPAAPVASIAGSNRYSWIKAPRYNDDPMEVGPLARMLVALATGQEPATSRLRDTMARIGIGPEALVSTDHRPGGRGTGRRRAAGRLARRAPRRPRLRRHRHRRPVGLGSRRLARAG